METSVVMACILGFLGALLYILSDFQKVLSDGNFLPTQNNLAKRQFEVFALSYTCVWILVFGVVIVTQAYESFDEHSYMTLCVSLAAPFLLQPVLAPLPAEKNLPLFLRYSFKANVWIAIFSFIGNY